MACYTVQFFVILLAFGLAFSVGNFIDVQNLKDEIPRSGSPFQIQNVYTSNCTQLENKVNLLTANVSSQHQLLKNMANKVNTIGDGVDKQSSALERMASILVSMNSTINKQSTDIQTLSTTLKAQEDLINTLIQNQNKSDGAKIMSCPSGFGKFENFCYKHNSSRLTWPAAQDVCRSMGGYLAEPRSEAQNGFIKDLFPSSFRYAWLGASDRTEEGRWTWATGGDVSGFTNWAPGQPNNRRGNQDCMLMDPHDGRWWDFTCTYTAPFVCQAPLNVAS